MAFFTGLASSTTTSVASSAMTRLWLSVASKTASPDEPQQQGVDREDGRERRRVDERALDDDLDVHQPVADDRRRERERNEAQRDRRQLHRQRRPEAERVRQRVAERERDGAEAVPHRSTAAGAAQ